MLKRITRFIRNYVEHKAIVLMYHRVAYLESDVWNLTVTPTHFDQQLKLLKQLGNVISAAELAENLHKQKLPKRSIVITFDDGYADNYLIAKPLLEQYELPATFFITTGLIDQEQEFWWDVLEYIFLCLEYLPSLFSLIINGCTLNVDLSAEQYLSHELRQKHHHWKATTMPPPSQRAALYYKVWQLLKPLPHAAQQEQLRCIREWAGIPASTRPDYRSMTRHQLHDLSRNKLFTLGAHTITHPALGSHASLLQTQELRMSADYLAQASGREVKLLAYPYGDYSSDTTVLAGALNFQAAFTTKAKPVTKSADNYQLGRFQVCDFSAQDFRSCLNHWFTYF